MNFVKQPKNLLAALILFLSINIATHAEGIAFEEILGEENWKEVLSKSSENEKLIFVDLYTTWCGYCKMMDKNVFSDEGVGSYFNEQFINVKLDAETEFGAKLTTENKVSGFPTYLFVDKNGNTVKTVVGYMEAEEFLKAGKGSLTLWKNFSELDDAYKKGTLKKEQASEYLAALKEKGLEDKAIEVANSFVKSFKEDDYKHEANNDLVLYAGYDLEGTAFKYVLDNKDSFDADYLKSFVEASYNHNLMNAIATQDVTVIDKIVEKIVAYNSETDDELAQGEFYTRKIFYFQLGEWEKYSALINDYRNEYASTDDEFLFREAYSIIENSEDKKGLELAISWIEETEKEKPEFKVFLLHSYALGMVSEFEEALVYAKKAEDIAANEEEKQTINEVFGLLNKAMQAK
ncbi:thioredoxin fold domain-containing protein [Flammeovirgaceae bacterium SG7u.111]|nr:thioredoxin fold domain-containing protein [Flammeovirgaceae bacterium SG7u.132]WPO34475.1 thioredoxin fold domain-containing protein [Flammeovirgaceae bacterium SG7u.111]